jgi:hypothetical protein
VQLLVFFQCCSNIRRFCRRAVMIAAFRFPLLPGFRYPKTAFATFDALTRLFFALSFRFWCSPRATLRTLPPTATTARNRRNVGSIPAMSFRRPKCFVGRILKTLQKCQKVDFPPPLPPRGRPRSTQSSLTHDADFKA